MNSFRSRKVLYACYNIGAIEKIMLF